MPLLLVILLISGNLPFIAQGLGLPQSIGIPAMVREAGPILVRGHRDHHYGAYMAEVYRAGIEAVPGGQMEAARSLGMNHRQAMRQVIVPRPCG